MTMFIPIPIPNKQINEGVKFDELDNSEYKNYKILIFLLDKILLKKSDDDNPDISHESDVVYKNPITRKEYNIIHMFRYKVNGFWYVFCQKISYHDNDINFPIYLLPRKNIDALLEELLSRDDISFLLNKDIFKQLNESKVITRFDVFKLNI